MIVTKKNIKMTFTTFQFHKQEELLEMQLMKQRGKEAKQ